MNRQLSYWQCSKLGSPLKNGGLRSRANLKGGRFALSLTLSAWERTAGGLHWVKDVSLHSFMVSGSTPVVPGFEMVEHKLPCVAHVGLLGRFLVAATQGDPAHGGRGGKGGGSGGVPEQRGSPQQEDAAEERRQ